VTVRDRLIERMVGELHERDDVAMNARAMDLEVLDHMVSAAEHERVVAGAAHDAVITLTRQDDIVAGPADERQIDLTSGNAAGVND
jgi:hypothetical protein